MFIKNDMQDAYFESYWGASCWEEWGDTFIMWPELLEVW